MKHALYDLVKAYDEWIEDEIKDEELIEFACTFAREWAEHSGYQLRWRAKKPRSQESR